MGKVSDVIINPILGVLFALALVYFLWGMASFVIHAQAEDKRTEGKRHMINGLIGMTVMVSVFAILEFALSTFGVTNPVDPLPF